MRLTKIVLSLALLPVAACGINTLEVQWDYAKSRDACQLEAETRVNNYQGSTKRDLDAKERNGRLVSTFNECMMSKNWDLGKPKEVATSTPADGGGIIDSARTKGEAEADKNPVEAKPASTKLENAGVGIGAGPTYQLVRKPTKPITEGEAEEAVESSAPEPAANSGSGPLNAEEQKRVLQILREGQ